MTIVAAFQLIYLLVWCYPLATRALSVLRTFGMLGGPIAGDRKRTAFWFLALTQVGFIARWFIFPHTVGMMGDDEISWWCALYVMGCLTGPAVLWANSIEDGR